MISVGIVIPVLKEYDLSRTPFGQTVIGVALVGELLSILVLTLVDAFSRHGMTWAAGIELGKLGGAFVLALLVLKLLYLAAWWNPERVDKIMESEDPVEEGIRAVVSVAFAGGLLASMAGAEPILGSFLAGMVFRHAFRSTERFEEKINALGFGFLIPFFFMGVGAQLEPSVLLSSQRVGQAVLLTVMVQVSNLFALTLARPLGLSLREAFSMSVLLSAPLSMIVVAGALGQKMGVLSEALNGVLILTALLASVFYPLLFRLLCKADKEKTH